MAFCKYCGREIPENSVCDCPDAQAEANNNPASGAPANETQTVASNQKTGFVVIGVAVAILLIIIIALLSSIFGGGYKKPVKDFEKSLNEGDGKLFIEAMLPEKFLDDVDDSQYELISDLVGSLKDFAEDEYGKNVKFIIDIEDKEKLEKDEISALESLYTSTYGLDVEITKGYELDTELTVKGKKGKDSKDMELVVFKIEGEGWKISPESLAELN